MDRVAERWQPLSSPPQLEQTPGPSVKLNDEIRDFICRRCCTDYRPVGTSKVVGRDGGCRCAAPVRSLGRLRAVDSSIMSSITSDNTLARSMIGGEKGAALILTAGAQDAPKPVSFASRSPGA